MSDQTINNADLANYVNLLVQLHRLIVLGRGDADEADELRDRMDGPWYRLTEQELRLVDTLAEDLYRIDGEVRASDADKTRFLVDLQLLEIAGIDESPEGDKLREALEEVWSRMNNDHKNLMEGLSADLRCIGAASVPGNGWSAEVTHAFEVASTAHDWGGALSILREHTTKVSSVELAAMRGVCWSNLGEEEAALVFFGDALRRMPENIVLQALYLRSLVRTGRFASAKLNANYLAQSASSHALLLLLADILLQCTVNAGGNALDRDELKKIIELVDRVPVDTITAETDPLLRAIASSGYMSAVVAHEALGNAARSADAYRVAASLAQDPQLQEEPRKTTAAFIVAAQQQRAFTDSSLMAAIPAITSH